MKTRIRQLFVASGCPEALSGTVVLTVDAEIQQLNRDFRHTDRATDVLSFPMLEGEGSEFVGDLLGDIVISVETAARQADEGRHRERVATAEHGDWTLEDELVFLVIHGLLHLLGHDHYDPEEDAEMRAEEARIWAAISAGES